MRPKIKGDDCVSWNAFSDTVRSGMVMGWLSGIQAADSQNDQEIMSKLWPSGHRVGSVVLEIIAECKSNPRQTIPDSIRKTALRLNRVK
jgi:hypothetical protein